jgi:ABC-type lipoprotein release transport system permease subunit
MNWKLLINIALTHLFTKRRQTIVAMLGVMFGISMFITMISFMTGVNQWMEDVAMDGTPHVRIFNPMEVKERKIIDAVYTGSNSWRLVGHQKPSNDLPKIRNAALLAKELEANPDVEGVAPQLATQAFFNNGPIKISGSISGMDVRKQEALFKLQSKVEDGSLDDLLTGSNAILLGRGLARKLNAVGGQPCQHYHAGRQYAVAESGGHVFVWHLHLRRQQSVCVYCHGAEDSAERPFLRHRPPHQAKGLQAVESLCTKDTTPLCGVCRRLGNSQCFAAGR